MKGFPFYYRGRKVIGMKPITRKQYWKSYIFIWSWFFTFLYVFIRSFFADVYLLKHEVAPVLAVTVFCFLWTYFVRRQVNRQNYIYEDKEN